MSSLMLALLATVALTGCNHFIPWGWMFRKGMPGLIMLTIHLGILIVPLTFLFLDWGKQPLLTSLYATPHVGVWIASIWLLVCADLATEFTLYMYDRYMQMSTSSAANLDENDSLKANLE